MTASELAHKVTELAERFHVPGAAAGVYRAGEESYAFHGVTNLENPLPVDASTLFQFGSTGKTYTAAAILCLVERGQVELAAPVRRYLPELRLADESVAAAVTVLQLLNHTAGWSGDFEKNTGYGDDALARYVAAMADIDQVSPLGSTVSYNNAALSVAGRVIEKVTGKTYEQAIKDLLLYPLGLHHTFFFPNDVMTRRFVVGHLRQADGTVKIARPWALPRSGNPAGGMSATAADQIGWARYHLSGGLARDRSRVLGADLIERMREPTVHTAGSALGDAIGLAWMLRDVDGVRVVNHGGTTVGQHAGFAMVPERDFAVVSLTNGGPGGAELNSELERWALKTYLGVVDREPEPIDADAGTLVEFVGTYETIAVTVKVTAAPPRLVLLPKAKPEFLAEIGEEAPPEVPITVGLLPGDGDRYVVPDGPAKGMRGYFTRGPDGAVDGVHVGGRYADRTRSPQVDGRAPGTQ